MQTWQTSEDLRSQADDLYQPRQKADEEAMKNINSPTGGRFLSLAEPCDDNAMNWQNNTKRQVDEAKEKKNNHLPLILKSKSQMRPSSSPKTNFSEILC